MPAPLTHTYIYTVITNKIKFKEEKQLGAGETVTSVVKSKYVSRRGSFTCICEGTVYFLMGPWSGNTASYGSPGRGRVQRPGLLSQLSTQS